MCKSASEYFPGSSSGYWDCYEAFELFADPSVSNQGTFNARLADIALRISPSSIVAVSVVSERMWYEASPRGSNFEYDAVPSLSAAVTDICGPST